MTELETLLLRQLEQQQRASEELVSGLSVQLERLQTALSEQQTALSEQQSESQTLRRELEKSDRKNAELFSDLTRRVDYVSDLLEHFGSEPRA